MVDITKKRDVHEGKMSENKFKDEPPPTRRILKDE
jgi:hypothetical protein